MGKHEEYREDLCNSVVNAVNNRGFTKAESYSSILSIQTAYAWIKIKARRGTLETKLRSG